MNLQIGKNIRRLRRKRDFTQEEMAAHLGISFQSISKWERGEGYPDITMLPVLARYFQVTLDELVGMDEWEATETYEAINRTWEENRKKGWHRENAELMRNALKQFPNDALLLVQLSSSLHRMGETEEEKAAFLREAIDLEEQILRYGDDSEIRNATQFNICFSYWKNGDCEKAIAHARKLPNLYKCQENALVHFLQGEEKHAVARQALVPLNWAMQLHLNALADTEQNDQWRIKARQIHDLLLGDHES